MSGAPPPGTMHRLGSNASDVDPAYFATLGHAPQTALIRLVIEYHETLIKSGRKEEAKQISEQLAALAAQHKPRPVDLAGMDLLLKDGLLNFLLSINQYLPVNPSQIVKFRNVGLSQVRPMPGSPDTIGSTLLKMVAGPCMPVKTYEATVLKDVSGYLMPGTLTLFMGPRGCGKSTLHQVLGGRLNIRGRQGEVTYNDRPVTDIIVNRLAAVVDELDNHLPTLSVLETLEVARDFTLLTTHDKFGPELQDIFKDAVLAGHDPRLGIILNMMGLTRQVNVPAGSDDMPTTTLDERHRLSTAEMLAGGYQVYFFDELNGGGTDEVLTFEMLKAMQTYTRVRRLTVAASLVSPSPEVVDLFDRIILFDNGRVIYQGHRLDALAYFASIGYVKPPQVELAEFLNEVASDDGVRYLQSGFLRLDTEGFVAAYEGSAFFRDIQRVLEEPTLLEQVFVESEGPSGLRFGAGPSIVSMDRNSHLGHPTLANTAGLLPGDTVVAVSGPDGSLDYAHRVSPQDLEQKLSGGKMRLHVERPFSEPKTDIAHQFDQPYIKPMWDECKELTWRTFQTTLRNSFGIISRAFTVIFLALFTGTLILRAPRDAETIHIQLRRSIFFTSVATLTVINMGQMPGFFQERAVYYKHSQAKFFRPFSYWFGLFFGGLPFSLFEGFVWGVLVYFLCGLSLQDGGYHFWVFLITSIFIALNGNSAIRLVAYLCPTFDSANALFGVWLASQMAFAGNLMPHFKIPNYWIWFYYIDPMQWYFSTMEVSEFGSSSYKKMCSEVGADYPVEKGGQSAYQGLHFPFCVGRSGPFPHLPPGKDVTVGHAWQSASQFFSDLGWIGVGIGMMLAWLVLLNILTYLSIAFIRHARPLEEGTAPPQPFEDKDDKQLLQDTEFGARGITESAVPTDPVTLSWHNVDYEATNPVTQQVRSALKGVSGWAKPGDMLAILGGQLSSKSVLLDVLSGRAPRSPLNFSGTILVNGFPLVPATFSKVSAFVERATSYLPFATVRESLEFSAHIRLGKYYSAEQKVAAVEETLDHMQLRGLEHRQVCTLGQGIAAEQARRLAIAVEMASCPAVLFVDHPTTGLDSRNALLVINCLKSYSATGRSVIATISHPSFRLSQRFTNALILARGGETVYFGPVGASGAEIKNYLESIPASPRLPPTVNPAVFAIDLIGDGVAETAEMNRNYAFEYRISDLNQANLKELELLRNGAGSLGPQVTRSGYSASWGVQAWTLFVRYQQQYYRNAAFGIGRLMFSVVIGLLFGSLFWQEIITNNNGTASRAGQVFEYTTLLGIFNAAGIIPEVAASLAAFKRERRTNSYHVYLWNLSWLAAEVPYLAIMVTVFCAIANTMSGLATGSFGQFFLFTFILFEDVLVITMLAAWLAAALPFTPLASTIIPIIISIWIPTGGLVIQRVGIPVWYTWVYWSNPQAYAYNALLSTALYCNYQDDVRCTPIPPPGAGPPLMKSPPGCPCPILTDSQVYVWQSIKELRSLDHPRVPLDMVVLALYVLMFYLFFGFTMRFAKHLR